MLPQSFPVGENIEEIVDNHVDNRGNGEYIASFVETFEI
jgi:hypothetical protein